MQEAVKPVAPQLLNYLTSPTDQSLKELITPWFIPKLALQALVGFQYPKERWEKVRNTLVRKKGVVLINKLRAEVWM